MQPSLFHWLVLALLICPALLPAQDMHLQDTVRTHEQLTNTTVTLGGRSELRLTGSGDPMVNSLIHFNSPDAVLRLTAVRPSQVADDFLSRIRVDGAPASSSINVRVVQYGEGTIVLPHGPQFAALTIFADRHFTGGRRTLSTYREYDEAGLGPYNARLGSLQLKRGYMATLAQEEDGTGYSRCYIAQDSDLDVARLPAELENNVRFIRVFPWRWVTKKGIAGNIESGLNVQWLYNWNLDRESPLDWEYVPIRQTQWWPGLDQDWRQRGATHLLGFNEPDRPDQANMSVSAAIGTWPTLLNTGLRVGAPAVSDGGLGWLYDFMDEAEEAGLRVDFVPVHYYRCYGNVGDPNGTASQFYNFLRGIYDVVQRPLWVTEWNNGANWTGCADPSFAQQEAAIEAMIQMLDDTPFVERYALYNWVEDERRVKWDDGSLTDAGVAYRDQNSVLAYRQTIPASGGNASASFSFDGHTRDETGNGHGAARVGSPSYASGRHGQAMQLNGTTDYLQLPSEFAATDAWSFAGWIYWQGGGNWQRIFDFGQDTSRYLFLTPRSGDGTLRFAARNGGSEQRLDAQPLPINTWTHVAVTLTGDSGKLFVNGVLADSNPNLTIDPEDFRTTYNYLGRSQYERDPLFQGMFDDFRFVASALSDSVVSAIANAIPPRFNASTLRKQAASVLEPYQAALSGDVNASGLFIFSKLGGPSWLSVAPNGMLTGTPSLADGGLNEFVVRLQGTSESYHTARVQIEVPTLMASIQSADDDAEQAANGDMSLGSSDLELVNDSAGGAGNQIIGLRFEGLAIPQGSLITNATLQFTSDESQSEPTDLTIRVEAADHSAPFASTAYDLGRRSLAPWSVTWQPEPWTAGRSGEDQRSPNLAGLLQEVISRPGWRPGQALTLIISGMGHRTAESADKAGGIAPRLLVGYALPSGAHTFTNWTGGRAELSDPKGDFDGDGYEHLFEYGLHLDGDVPETNILPLYEESFWLYLTYTRPSAAADIRYHVQWSDRLGVAANWTSFAITHEITADDGTLRTVRSRIPRGGTGQRFVRMRVEQVLP